MCGIFGFGGNISKELLQHGVRSVSHRGPDDSGDWFIEGQVGLGHARLSILDVSPLGHQPMVDDSTGNVLVFNGEIYNFQELKASLVAKGVSFKSQTDTEVLLKLYAEHGAAMLSMLNGIFAFSLWDAATSTLFIARDALGVKPLYFVQTVEGVAFSSELKALRCLFSTELEIDHSAIEKYLTFLWCPGEGTPIKDVRKLGPGEAMTIKDGKIADRWQWYSLPVFRTPSRPMSEPDAVEGTRTQLREAVHRQMVADVPVGAFLSGGLDSSAVVAFAREHNPDIRCFTIDPLEGDEAGNTRDLPYARHVADHLGVPLDVVSVSSQQMADSLESMVVQLDEPLADPAPLNVLFISQLARENGIKVLLSGAGGDDIFTGYRRHQAINLEQYWSWLPKTSRGWVSEITSKLDARKPLSRRLAKLFANAELEGDARLISYLYWASPQQVRSLFSSEAASILEGVTVQEPMMHFLSELKGKPKALNRMLALEQRFFLTDHNLTYTDKMSMAAGVEVRVPFLDLELVEFAEKIPVSFKQKGREGKWVLKKAMEPYLPREVIYRPKTGFGAPLRNWLNGELKVLLNDVLSEDSIRRRGIFNEKAIMKMIDNNERGVVDASYTLLSLMCIEIWCRHFIDRQNASCGVIA